MGEERQKLSRDTKVVPRNVEEYGIVMGSGDETLLPLFHAAHSRDLQHDPPTSLSEPHWGGGEIP